MISIKNKSEIENLTLFHSIHLLACHCLSCHVISLPYHYYNHCLIIALSLPYHSLTATGLVGCYSGRSPSPLSTTRRKRRRERIRDRIESGRGSGGGGGVRVYTSRLGECLYRAIGYGKSTTITLTPVIPSHAVLPPHQTAI